MTTSLELGHITSVYGLISPSLSPATTKFGSMIDSPAITLP